MDQGEKMEFFHENYGFVKSHEKMEVNEKMELFYKNLEFVKSEEKRLHKFLPDNPAVFRLELQKILEKVVEIKVLINDLYIDHKFKDSDLNEENKYVILLDFLRNSIKNPLGVDINKLKEKLIDFIALIED